MCPGWQLFGTLQGGLLYLELQPVLAQQVSWSCACSADQGDFVLQLRLIDFSPEDRFMATFSPVEPANPREKAGLVLNLFDTRTGRKLRAFEGSADDFAVGAAADPTGALRWPVFKWAGGCGDRCGVLAWQLRKMC